MGWMSDVVVATRRGDALATHFKLFKTPPARSQGLYRREWCGG